MHDVWQSRPGLTQDFPFPDPIFEEGRRLVHSGRLDEAETLSRALRAGHPDDGRGWLLQGLVDLRRRTVPDAVRHFARAFAVDSDLDPVLALEERWMAFMLLGDYEAAWRLSDLVLANRAPSDFNRPWTPYHTRCVWNGRKLPGRRVLIRCYHGLGDTLQFIRFAEPLERMGCHVAVEAQPELLPLLRHVRGIGELVPLGEGDGLDWDVDVESMELAHALRVRPDTLPASPYVGVTDEVPPVLRAGRPLRIGLVWQAGTWDMRRSLQLNDLRPLLSIGGVEFHSLQQGPARAELPTLAEAGPIDSAQEGIAALAATLMRMDRLITVDTMAAHLAGALGIPAWLLLHYEADWRWGMGARTPWYPTLHLVRQAVPGDWSVPIRMVRHALDRLACSHHADGG